MTIKCIKNREASGVEIPEVFDFLEEAEKIFSCHSFADKRISIFTFLAFHEQKPQRSSSRMDCFSLVVVGKHKNCPSLKFWTEASPKHKL